MLEEHGIDLTDMAFRLSDTLPFIISTDFNPNASAHIIRASMLELKEAMAKAKPLPQTMTRDEWLARRGAAPGAAHTRKEHGKATGAILAPVPETGTMGHGNTNLNKLVSPASWYSIYNPPSWYPSYRSASPGAACGTSRPASAAGTAQGCDLVI